MAGGKKTAKKLTPEEWLKQALVPVEEQPYAVPGNWCWTTVGNLASLYRGVSYKKKDAHIVKEEDDYLIMRGGNIGEGYINTQGDNIYVNKSFVNENQLVHQNDIVIVASTGSKKVIGRAGISKMDYSDVSFGTFLMLVRPINKSNSKYLDYFFQSNDYRNRIRNLASGVNINNIRADYIIRMPIPLPPAAEQRRIVALIERLFAKLDEAKEKAQAVADGFELRRSAVLQKAFSGELTERWRQEHGVVLESWKRFSISSVCNSLKYGTAKKSEKTGSVVVIRMGNLQRGEIDWSDLAYSNDKDDIEKYHLDAGDVLFNRTNSAALVGKTSIYRGEYPAIYAGYLIKLDYKHDIITGEFLNYALNTNHAKEYCNSVKTDGVNQSNINAKKIGAYIIPVPTIDEQVKIVECLQNLLKKEQQAQKAVESAIDQIDIIKKAILSRAFRGELGTNDPKEENAENLLLKMFKEKDNVEHKIKPAAKDKTDTKTVHNFKSSLEETIYQFILNHPDCTLSEMKSLSGNFSDINKALLHLKQNKKVQISNSKYRVIIQDEDSISSIQ